MSAVCFLFFLTAVVCLNLKKKVVTWFSFSSWTFAGNDGFEQDYFEPNWAPGPVGGNRDLARLGGNPGLAFIDENLARIGEKIKCLSCGKLFDKIDKARRHVRNVHLKLKRFDCELCDSSFGRKDSYQKHFAKYHTWFD